MIEPQDVTDTISSIYDGNSKLDMLLEFEGVLDKLHLYAYKNWIKGEIVAGPEISRYWIEATVMYPRDFMPDPEGSLRLTKHGCYVYFQKETYIISKSIKTPDDLEQNDNGERKPKKIEKDVWLVRIVMPRHFVDEFKSQQIEVNGVEIDMSDVSDAYQRGLDSEEALKNDNDPDEDI